MEKGFLQSKTVWGAIFSFLAMAAQAAGLGNVAKIVSHPEWIDIAIALAGLGGTILTVYGRAKATQPVALGAMFHGKAQSPMIVGAVAIGMALMLSGCGVVDRFKAAETPQQKAQVALDEICGNYLAVDIAFNTVVAAAPPGKIPQRVIDAERAAVAGIKVVCDQPVPDNPIVALQIVASAYAAVTKSLADARAASE